MSLFSKSIHESRLRDGGNFRRDLWGEIAGKLSSPVIALERIVLFGNMRIRTLNRIDERERERKTEINDEAVCLRSLVTNEIRANTIELRSIVRSYSGKKLNRYRHILSEVN